MKANGIPIAATFVALTLVRLITDAKTHITGTPQKFDPMEMMRRQRERE